MAILWLHSTTVIGSSVMWTSAATLVTLSRPRSSVAISNAMKAEHSHEMAPVPVAFTFGVEWRSMTNWKLSNSSAMSCSSTRTPCCTSTLSLGRFDSFVTASPVIS